MTDNNVTYLPERPLTLEQIDERRAAAREAWNQAFTAGDEPARMRALFEINRWRIARARYLARSERQAS